MDELAERVACLETDINNLKGWQEKQNGCLQRLEEKISQVIQNLNSRPTWAVSVLMTFLCSVCVGLIVYIVGR
ncbi:MAG TPA: hypothetical protein DCX03_02210 [Bacteroidales bacterium]|nr:hypothetical protein [Bacteroidales bacterium]